jgi:hypothetical protein
VRSRADAPNGGAPLNANVRHQQVSPNAKAPLKIPESVKKAILEYRAEVRAQNSGRRKSFLFGLIKIKSGFEERPETLGAEQEFWTIADDQQLEEFLFSDLLAALYPDGERVLWKALPSGYAPLLLVLEFERHCDFEGWTAVSNKGVDEMREIIRSYEVLGVPSEAKALTAVLARFQAVGDNPDELGAAYSSVPNDMAERGDRMGKVLAFIRNHPERFGVV